MNTVRLREIATITQGNTPARSRPEYWNGTIPWVPTALIQNQTIKKEMISERITEIGLQKTSMKIFPKGTILMAMIGQGKTRGQVAVLDVPAAINQNAAAITLSNDAHNGFVYHQLRYRYNEIRTMSNGAGQQNLNTQLIGSIVLYLPEKKEQAAISTLLDYWDLAIEKTKRLAIFKELRLSWFRSNYLSGKLRLKEYRRRWHRLPLSEFVAECIEPSKGNEPVFSVSVHKGLIDQIEHLGRSFAANNTEKYNLVRPGDIVYTRSPTGDFPYGIIKLSQADTNCIVSPLYGVFRPATSAHGFFLDALFESPIITTNYLRPLVQKGAKNTISVLNETFMKGTIELPSDIDELKRLVAIYRTQKREIAVQEKLLDEYRQQKTFLMSKLLTGEWEAPNLGAEAK